MIEDSKIVKAISKINKLTKQSEISWIINKHTRVSLPGDETLFGYVYESNYQGQKLRLYKYNYRIYTDEDEYVTLTTTRLSFVESNGQSLWDFPNNRGIDDLYDSVRFKTSNAEDFFSKLLTEEEEDEEDEDELDF